MDDTTLAEIRERLGKATTGPWQWTKAREVDGQPSMYAVFSLPVPGLIAGECKPHDAAFIAHSWQDVKDLLDEVDRLRAELAERDAMRAQLAP